MLVATDAAGEGLNLHHRCRLVIDLELPWNPLRLEQRVGRVDRLGQRRTVHAIRLFHPHTIEQRVLEHLRLRDRRAEAALERHHVTETTIANAIFEGHSIDATAPMPIVGVRVAAATGEAQRSEFQRRAHRAGARNTIGPLWTAPRNGRRTDLVLLMRRSLANDSGVVVCDEIEARVLALPAMRHRRECRQLIDRERERLRCPADEVMQVAVAQQPRRVPGGDHTAPPRRPRADTRARRRTVVAVRSSSRSGAVGEAGRHPESSMQRCHGRSRRSRYRRAERTRVELIAAWPETRVIAGFGGDLISHAYLEEHVIPDVDAANAAEFERRAVRWWRGVCAFARSGFEPARPFSTSRCRRCSSCSTTNRRATVPEPYGLRGHIRSANAVLLVVAVGVARRHPRGATAIRCGLASGRGVGDHRQRPVAAHRRLHADLDARRHRVRFRAIAAQSARRRGAVDAGQRGGDVGEPRRARSGRA